MIHRVEATLHIQVPELIKLVTPDSDLDQLMSELVGKVLKDIEITFDRNDPSSSIELRYFVITIVQPNPDTYPLEVVLKIPNSCLSKDPEERIIFIEKLRDEIRISLNRFSEVTEEWLFAITPEFYDGFTITG